MEMVQELHALGHVVEEAQVPAGVFERHGP
jgi:hypothetical protein